MNTKETSKLLLEKLITYDRHLQDEIIKLGGIDRGRYKRQSNAMCEDKFADA